MPKPFIDPDSADTMGRTIWGEARGESRSGKIAIGWVIRNRAEIDLLNDGAPDWWGEGIIGVCKRPGQFSC
jgi:N-acetylmuramoyl-L-alanine amidase